MENHSKKPYAENDVEMGSMLQLFVRGFKKIENSLISFFRFLGHCIIVLLLFIKKYAIFLILSLIVGYGLGAYTTWAKGSKYQSTMSVRTNFGSSRALYNAVEYLNALVSEGKTSILAKLLMIDEKAAGNLSSFDVIPVMDEISVTQLYKDNFLRSLRKSEYRTDTFWTRTIEYKDFKKNLTKHDYPFHEVQATSTQSDIFPSLEKGLILLINNNSTLQKNLEIAKSTQQDEERIIMSSIDGLDTLRDVYNSRLRQQPVPAGATTTVNLLDKSGTNVNPELELYEKVLLLKDELTASRTASFNRQGILQVYSSFNPVGKKLSVLRQNGFTYAYLLLSLVTLVCILIECNRWLGRRGASNHRMPSRTDSQV